MRMYDVSHHTPHGWCFFGLTVLRQSSDQIMWTLWREYRHEFSHLSHLFSSVLGGQIANYRFVIIECEFPFNHRDIITIIQPVNNFMMLQSGRICESTFTLRISPYEDEMSRLFSWWLAKTFLGPPRYLTTTLALGTSSICIRGLVHMMSAWGGGRLVAEKRT